ncbi:MAG: hypothetical protein DSY32_01920 [Aquifex sp.]|nr:MAG: hypothetical protein DSY32_01920 [Aquifex sp.]
MKLNAEFFIRLIGLRDAYTRGHTERGVFYAQLIGSELGLTSQEIELLKIGGYIHDIGKVAIPDVILLKPTRLTPEEYEIMKLHVELGYELVKDLDIPKESIDVLLHHQERYDGTGYPFGKKGKEIPFLARIYTIADAFEAMTAKRIYKKAKNWNEALRELEELAGKQFDPDIVPYAVRALSKIRALPLGENNFPEEIEKIRWSFYYLDSVTGAVKGDLFLPTLRAFIDKGEPFCLTLFDIYNLLEFNRKHGWEEGNRVLKKLVEVINIQCCSMMDVKEVIMKIMRQDILDLTSPVTFRIGGDEFAVITPYIPPQEKVLNVVKTMEEEGVKIKFFQMQFPYTFKRYEEVLEVLRRFMKKERKREI